MFISNTLPFTLNHPPHIHPHTPHPHSELDAGKVNDGESLDPMVEPTMCPSDLYLFTLGTYIFVAVGFVLGLCCFGAQLKFKTCPRTFGTSGDDSEV